MKITINNEEVLCNKDFTINEEMLNTSSVILNNVYPKTWEQDKDYVSRFYYPKDYSKCKIFNEIYHPEEKEEVEGTSFSITADLTKQYQVQTLKGQTTQSGTPTPTNPQPINITTGRQVVSVCGKNLFNEIYPDIVNETTKYISLYVGEGTFTMSSNAPLPSNNPYASLFFITGQATSGASTGGNGVYLNRPITIASTNGYVTIGYRIYDGINPEDYQTQVEKGNQATTYEEVQNYEINLGKNLCDIVLDSSVTGNITYKTYTLAPNTQYTVSTNTWVTSTSTANIFVSAGTSFSPSSATNGVNGSRTVTSDSNGKVTIGYRNVNNSMDYASGTYWVQLEKGSIATSYSPYKTPIYLGKIGTYQDYIFRNTTENPLYDSTLEEGQWYIHKEIGKYNEWSSVNRTTAFTNTTAYQFVLPIPTDSSKRAYAKSNYFQNHIDNNDTEHFFIGTSTPNVYSGLNVFISNSRVSTSAEAITWLKNNGVEVYYVLNTPTTTLIEDEELINQLNSIELLEGLNNVSVSSPYLPFIMSLMYNYQEGYTEEDILFCGIVKNTGEISLNPRHPHYCNIQVLDFKDFLSQGETLDFVITEKTIGEAIDQVIGTIAPYGFIKGNILLDDINDAMGTYSTKDKTAYDVFNYIADITQSRWTTRMVDENTVAIDFYDPNKLPLGEQIEYNQTWFRNHKIDDLSYSYSSNDYRNKQVMLSGEVYSNIETTEILVADGYQTQFNTIDKIGKVSSLLLNGTPVSIITKDEYDLGYDADFYYQPGNKYFESVNLVSTGAILTIVYYAIIEGREVILNQDEISLIEERTGRKGVVARYETRNDATTTGELQAIGQSYLDYKGIPEIILKVSSRENTWNIGDRVYFNAPLDELKQTYMVKSKKIQRITTIDEIFYTYELTSSFNMEQDINYFDNQRYKSKGNIGEGEFISRNIDIENTANVIFYDLEVEEVEVEGNSILQSELQSVLGGVE